MEDYSGVCIGGPYGGKTKINQGRYLHAVIMPEFSNRMAYDGEVDFLYAELEAKRFIYRWDRIVVDNEEFGVWIPDGWTWQQVFTHLFKHYKPRDRKKKKK